MAITSKVWLRYTVCDIYTSNLLAMAPRNGMIQSQIREINQAYATGQWNEPNAEDH